MKRKKTCQAEGKRKTLKLTIKKLDTKSPLGMNYTTKFCSLEEQAKLLEFFSTKKWNTKSLTRRTQHYGYEYSYTSKNIAQCEPIPLILDSFISQLSFTVDQVIVNEYTSTQGISAHIDKCDIFDEQVAVLSLGKPCLMVFHECEKIDINILKEKRVKRVTTGKKYRQKLDECSLLTLCSDSRYHWKHEIPKTKKWLFSDGTQLNRDSDYRRVSVTFRKVISSS